MNDPWEDIDWVALERLRTGFLDGTAGSADYWESETDLQSYDLTYAQRIGWKWDHILADLKRRRWFPPQGPVMDWGCGSGIAHRSFLRAFPETAADGLALEDRSKLAVQYSRKTVHRFFPRLHVLESPPGQVGTLLVSHVLTEMDDSAITPLLERISTAESVIWVEPGTFEASRRLIALREALRDKLNIVAPCVHREACGMLTESNAPHWCHQFASPPGEAFTSPHWAAFARMTGIDLRSLSVSYLVLDRRPTGMQQSGSVEMIGRPRVYKAHALVLGCDRDGVAEARLSKRNLPDAFRKAKKDKLEDLQLWERDGIEITRLDPVE